MGKGDLFNPLRMYCFSVVWRASPGTGEHGGGGQLHLPGGNAPRLHPCTHPPSHRPPSILRQAQLLGRLAIIASVVDRIRTPYYGVGSGSGRIRNFLPDPDPE